MSTPVHPLHTQRVLTAIAGDHLLAFPSAATGLITACPCGDPPPGAAPWLGGVAVWQGRVLWVLDPAGLLRAGAPGAGGDERAASPRERLVVVVEPGDDAPGWGVVITAPAALAEAAPVSGHLFAGCPGGWLRPCLLQDGRRAWLIDTTLITSALRLTEAA